MVQNDGDGIGSFASHMDEMNGHAVDLCAKLWEAIDPRFLRAPVVIVLPIGHQFTQVSAVDSIGPVLIVEFGGPACAG